MKLKLMQSFSGTEAWEIHGKSKGKIPWNPLKTIEHGAGAKFHGFHGLAWNRKIVKNIPHESMEYKTIENNGKHREFTKMKPWKPWKAWYLLVHYF